MVSPHDSFFMRCDLNYEISFNFINFALDLEFQERLGKK